MTQVMDSKETIKTSAADFGGRTRMLCNKHAVNETSRSRTLDLDFLLIFSSGINLSPTWWYDMM